MADRAAVIAAMLMDRPMCLDCISAKSGLSTTKADRYLTSIGISLRLRRSTDRCRACGIVGIVFSLHRSSD
jgi:hypothetical protein